MADVTKVLAICLAPIPAFLGAAALLDAALLDPTNERYDAKEARAAETAANAAAEAEKQRSGFHCLSTWDGSHRSVKKYTQEQMREPDSFEHIETRMVTSVKVVEIRVPSEVAIGHAALDGSCCRGSGSAAGMRSSAMTSTCM